MTELSRALAQNMRDYFDGGDQSEEPKGSEYKTKDLVDVFRESLGGQQEKETDEGVDFVEQLIRSLRELGV